MSDTLLFIAMVPAGIGGALIGVWAIERAGLAGAWAKWVGLERDDDDGRARSRDDF